LTKDELITKQALEIERLKELVTISDDKLLDINRIICCIGGPLNDNKLKYTNEQLTPFWKISKLIEN